MKIIDEPQFGPMFRFNDANVYWSLYVLSDGKRMGRKRLAESEVDLFEHFVPCAGVGCSVVDSNDCDLVVVLNVVEHVLLDCRLCLD